MVKSILDLAEISLFHIFSFLDTPFLMTKIPLVCKTWRDKIKADSFWRSLRSLTLNEEVGGTPFMEKMIAKCSNLRHLEIHFSTKAAFASALPLVITESPLIHLKSFSFLYGYPEVERTFLAIVKGAPHLNKINISGDVTEAMIEGVSHLKELVSFDVSALEDISADKMPFTQLFENCPKLEHMKIAFSDFVDGNVLKSLVQLRSSTLRSLSWFCSLSDEAVKTIAKCPLSTLKLACCEIGDQSLQSIKVMAHLHTLSIYEGEHFTSNGFRQLFDGNSLPHLKNLVLTECSGLDDSAVEALAVNCKKLETLFLENCSKVTDKGIDHFMQNCQKLRVLRLHGIWSDFHFLNTLPNYLPALRCLCLFGKPVNVSLVEKFSKLHPNFKSQKCEPFQHIDLEDMYNRHLKLPDQNPIIFFYNQGYRTEGLGHITQG